MRDHRALLGEALNVGGFLFQEAQRDEQREVRVHVPGGLEHAIEHALDVLPDRVAPGLDDHAATHGGILRQVGGANHLLVPFGIIFSPGGRNRCLNLLCHFCPLSLHLLCWSEFRITSFEFRVHARLSGPPSVFVRQRSGRPRPVLNRTHPSQIETRNSQLVILLRRFFQMIVRRDRGGRFGLHGLDHDLGHQRRHVTAHGCDLLDQR